MKKLIFATLCAFSIVINAGNLAHCKKKASYLTGQDSLVVTAPNVFTPNGDGINDTWSIMLRGHGVTVFDMETTVYDRWGKVVFQTTNIREVWSGHNSIGEFCTCGTYYYIIKYLNGATGKNEVFKGFIELMR
jgi:gliding motility-associated-like protein